MVKLTQEGETTVNVVFPQLEALIAALSGAGQNYAAVVAALTDIGRRLDTMASNFDQELQSEEDRLQTGIAGLGEQQSRLQGAVAGLHAEIDRLTVPATTQQRLHDLVDEVAQLTPGFAGIEPAPAPAQPAPDTGATPPADTTPVAPTDTTPVVDPTPAATTTPDAGTLPADTTPADTTTPGTGTTP